MSKGSSGSDEVFIFAVLLVLQFSFSSHQNVYSFHGLHTSATRIKFVQFSLHAIFTNQPLTSPSSVINIFLLFPDSFVPSSLVTTILFLWTNHTLPSSPSQSAHTITLLRRASRSRCRSPRSSRAACLRRRQSCSPALLLEGRAGLCNPPEG